MSVENPHMTEQANIDKDKEGDQSDQWVSVVSVLDGVRRDLSQRYQIVPTVGGRFSQNELYYKATRIADNVTPTTKGWFFWKKALATDSDIIAQFEVAFKESLGKVRDDLGGGKAVNNMCTTVYNAFFNDIASSRSCVVSQSLAIADSANQNLKRSISGIPGAFKVVPQASWFSTELQKISGRELLTIFPEAEAEVLLNVIGKAMIGYNGSDVLEGKVEHSARAYAIMIDQVGGLGKSTLMDYISEAITTLGFRASRVNANMSKFGWGEVISADMTFLDDLDNLKLGELISGHLIKSIVTNAIVRTEQKGQAAMEVKSTTTVLCASNTTDPRHLFDMDGGGKGRLNQLQTYTVHELDRKFDGRNNGFIKEHWAALSERLGCTTQDLTMLLLARAAETFSASIGLTVVGQRIVRAEDNLQKITKELRADLRISPDMTYTEDFMSSIANFMALSLALANVDKVKAEKILIGSKLDLEILLAYLGGICEYAEMEPEIVDLLVPKTLDKTSLLYMKDKLPQLKNQKNVRSYAKAFETAMLELLSVQGFAYPKALSFYDAKWMSATSSSIEAYETFKNDAKNYASFNKPVLSALGKYLTT